MPYTMFDITLLDTYREDNRLEAKKAKGGLPHSLWETYSAFANTDGGLILIGANEQAHSYPPDSQKKKCGK